MRITWRKRKHLLRTCSEFPCELLVQYSYDDKQGDDGKRIVQCRCWNKECNNGCEWLDTYLRSFPCVTRDFKEEWQWIRYQVGDKMFAAICKDATGKRDIMKELIEKSYYLVVRGLPKKKQKEILGES